jgi:hydroxyacylglutathione hydrolase
LTLEITTINLTGVNCYLLKTAAGFILIDTGFSNRRAYLEKRLFKAGCHPGDLKLIILTHGDSDHTANADYLRTKFGAKIAIHSNDAGMIERGDMSFGRKAKSDQVAWIFKIMMALSRPFFKAPKSSFFKPDFYIDENVDLSLYGLDGRVVHLPGHSKGSIAILTGTGDLFCGDFVYNIRGFGLINDMADWQSSVAKVKKLGIKTFYPGHGKTISMKDFLKKV